jgi:hypothetical protein
LSPWLPAVTTILGAVRPQVLRSPESSSFRRWMQTNRSKSKKLPFPPAQSASTRPLVTDHRAQPFVWLNLRWTPPDRQRNSHLASARTTRIGPFLEQIATSGVSNRDKTGLFGPFLPKNPIILAKTAKYPLYFSASRP